jgi:tetraacyldisaccharide 4'-kinase
MGLADVIVVNGANADFARRQLADASRATAIPQLSAHAVPSGETAWLSGAKVVAYAGIANPERFFSLLETLGAKVLERVAFGDHESLANDDAEKLLTLAGQHGAQLVTTEKDFARLAGLDRARVELHARSKTLPIMLHMPDKDRAALAGKVAAAIAART